MDKLHLSKTYIKLLFIYKFTDVMNLIDFMGKYMIISGSE